jgi:serine-type D-Ala-D-Ala carboxypeptidase/endopeptidase (penicillin-binding protein 4)
MPQREQIPRRGSCAPPQQRNSGAHCHPRLRKGGAIQEPWCWGPPEDSAHLLALLGMTSEVLQSAEMRTAGRTNPLAVLLFILASFSAFAADKPTVKDVAKQLQDRIQKIMNSDPGASRAFWGIEVEDAGTGKVLYNQNPDKLFTPASNTKLFTTAATFALIGPDYHFHTTIETTTPPDSNGRIAGDLVLVGRGDPNLSGRVLPYHLKTERVPPHAKALEELADQIVKAGVHAVDGDIVGDDSFFINERYGEGWSQDDLEWDYGAPMSALTVNDNVVFAEIKPAEHVGEKAFISVDPYTEYFQIQNLVTTAAAGSKRNIGIDRAPGSSQVVLWGTTPLDDKGDSEALAIDDPATANAYLLRRMLEKRGVVVLGNTRAAHKEIWKFPPLQGEDAFYTDAPAVTNTPAPAPVVLAQHDSLPLSEDLRVINKVSQNLHVEIMLRLLGKLKGPSGSISGGAQVVKNFLVQAGLTPDEFTFQDGSGMSRENLVTPEAIVKLLRYSSTQPWGAAFRDTLPVAAMDGSLTTRFQGTPAQGRVSAKTGFLAGVHALSGYAQTKHGNNIVFSVMLNHTQLRSTKAKELMDQVVNAVVEED